MAYFVEPLGECSKILSINGFLISEDVNIPRVDINSISEAAVVRLLSISIAVFEF